MSEDFKRVLGCKLVCIDDLHDKKFYADLIINHAPSADSRSYQAQPYTQFCLGLDYALLRPAFLNSAKEKRRINEVKNLFVCFGGSDNDNFTLNTIKQAVNLLELNKINIVVGASYLYFEELKEFCETINDCQLNIYFNITAPEMVNIMVDSHLAIVPSSSTSYEALSVGMPIITGYTVDNQKKIYKSLVKQELVLGIGTFPIKNLAKSIEIIKIKKNIMIENQSHFVDGKSGERLLQKFKDLNNEQ